MEVFELQGEYMRKMSNEEFFRFCRENPELKIERKANGDIEVMSPTGFQTGKINLVINGYLFEWYQKKAIGEVVGTDTGFTLPNGAMRSPDAAWVSEERVSKIPEEDKKTFPHVCPDFVVKLKSSSDRLKVLQDKMHEWIANGCRLGWLIVPEEEQVYIYQKDGAVDEVQGFDQKLSGEDVLPGFELDLRGLRIA